MNCPNCQTPNADGEQYCMGCGSELAGALPTGAIAAITAPQAATTPSATALATLSYGGQDFPLVEGSKFIIAREGTDKCTPDIAINAEGVSSTPVEVSVVNGVITVRDTGTSIGTRVVKYLDPGASIEVKAGEMIMLGNELILIG